MAQPQQFFKFGNQQADFGTVEEILAKLDELERFRQQSQNQTLAQSLGTLNPATVSIMDRVRSIGEDPTQIGSAISNAVKAPMNFAGDIGSKLASLFGRGKEQVFGSPEYNAQQTQAQPQQAIPQQQAQPNIQALTSQMTPQEKAQYAIEARKAGKSDIEIARSLQGK